MSQNKRKQTKAYLKESSIYFILVLVGFVLFVIVND